MTPRAPRTPHSVRLRRQAVAILALRRYLRTECYPGRLVLPHSAPLDHSVFHIAGHLGLNSEYVRAALRILDLRGDVAVLPHRGVLVLHPGQPHPRDAAMTDLIRSRITSGIYRPGHTLPLGLIALDLHVTARQLRRACRPLIHEGLVHNRVHGPHGPGLYVRAVPARPHHPRPTPRREHRP
ncbi:hypothetical protein GCM10010371_63790 [Streptomyces subrutilus]|uniref:HTH gntR-type domain-containing protein n=1 Tax=Streptomyces subrutilus TaxID=36818 RepID=A0A918RF58_9ACTN|nr:GntR family transcriptional regulator [Streptomyces subrutilus]GGZ95128.1 hypothetical protein GCM10010371_63790 [Streptomyces subrutilus]